MFAAYDKDSDDLLGLGEFKCLFCTEMGGKDCPDCEDEDSEEDPEEIFEEFAGDDGKISLNEFAVVYYLYGQEWTRTLHEIFVAYD